MSAEESIDQIQQPMSDPGIYETVHKKLSNLLTSKLGRFILAGSLLTGTFTFEQLTFDSQPAVADLLNYPWAGDSQAPCEFGSAGGDSCTNPKDSTDKYDWGVFDSNGKFHQYRSGYEYRNCTDYVQWKESTEGISVPNNLGNGGDWYNNAPASEQSKTPKAWDAAVVPATYNSNGVETSPGHVAFVESVSADGKSMTISEYNHDGKGDGDQRTVTIAGSGFTEFVDFGKHPANSDSNNSSNGNSLNNTPLVGDINGDGRADAVLVNPNNGDVWASLSSGSGFSNPTPWSSNPNIAKETKYFLADVNGDGMDDIVTYNSNGNWYAGLSSGSGFWAPTQWAANEGSNSSSQFLADVNGDGKSDVVYFNAPSGNWYVDESSGNGFYGPSSLWISGDGVGSSNQVVGDFNGDGKADAAVYFGGNGNWYVGLSSGNNFGYPSQWSAGHGMNSNLQLAGDINGDHEADISYFYGSGSNCGTWEAGTSAGSGFWQPTYWAFNEGCGGTSQFIADVDGDGKDDVVTYWQNAGATPAGTWSVDESSGNGFYGPPMQWINGFGNNYS